MRQPTDYNVAESDPPGYDWTVNCRGRSLFFTRRQEDAEKVAALLRDAFTKGYQLGKSEKKKIVTRPKN